MLYYSKNGRKRIVHFEGCGHIKRIYESDMESFESLAEARNKGYCICKCCNPAVKFYRLNKKKRAEFCSVNKLICFFHNDAVEVKSIYSQWRLMPNDEGGVDLYHKNTHHRKKDTGSRVCGYHVQKVICKDMISYLQYIVGHDNHRFSYLNTLLKSGSKKKSAAKSAKKRKAEQERRKKRERVAAIRNVYFIFDQLDAARKYG